MAKPRTRRDRRGRGRRAPAPPAPPSAPPVPTAPLGAVSEPEPSVTRFSARDYGYVRRELQRIVVLAVAIFATIIVLSFFLP